MKNLVFTCFLIIGLATTGCEKNTIKNNSTTGTGCLKGVLVKKGICGQRVVSITSKNKDGVAYTTQWADENTTYNNVFAVSNTCAFPATLNVGDEFSFELTTANDADCVQCQAFSPVPNEKNKIRVIADCTPLQQ